MSAFITREDYNYLIRSNRLEEILDDDSADYTADEILDAAEEEAVDIVRDSLHQYYDVIAIFEQTGEDRKKSLLGWLKSIVIYKIFERVSDELVPDRVVKNYNETMTLLDDIAAGKRSVDLPRKVDEEGNDAVKFAWGSETKRSHL